MAKWDKLKERGNVDDRRGQKMVRNGGIGLGGIIMVLIVGYFGGAEPALQLFSTINNSGSTQVVETTHQYDGEDEYEVFASTVLGSNNRLWNRAFAESGTSYTEPKLVLFRGATNSKCGGAVSHTGPHYCMLDKTIYLDETFFEELTKRFGAKGGDVAEAYVIAHEVGHHVQNELGIMDKTAKLRAQRPRDANKISVATELQADCFAGIWAGTIANQGILEKNEISEAIDAAAAVGDDAIQKKTSGRVQPESWTHGSSKQRKQWFLRGYEYQDFEKCDTFN